MSPVHVVGKLSKPLQGEAESDSDDSDADDMDDDWLDYQDMAGLSSGSSSTGLRRIKKVKVTDLRTKKEYFVSGRFHFQDEWWIVDTILRGAKYRPHGPIKYTLITHESAVHLFFTAVKLSENSRNQYEQLVRSQGYKKLSFRSLIDHVEDFRKRFKNSSQDPERSFDEDSQPCCWEDEFQRTMTSDRFDRYKHIKSYIETPGLFKVLPALLSNHFLNVLCTSTDVRSRLERAITDEPWAFGFRSILAKKGLYGVEASLRSYYQAEMFENLPDTERDALVIYDALKMDAMLNGHTYMQINSLKNCKSMKEYKVKDWNLSLDFMEENKVIKREQKTKKNYRVYLYYLWKAEVDIVEGFQELVREHQEQPWILDVNVSSADFENIKTDADQWKAANLIKQNSVVTISGKGGCGKTHVVTTVFKHTGNFHMLRTTSENSDCDDSLQENSDVNSDSSLFHETMDKSADDLHVDNSCCIDEETGDVKQKTEKELDEEYVKDQIAQRQLEGSKHILLTAPTGKAANLLGKRARIKSFTLHSVIFSFRMYQKTKTDKPWKFSDIKVLVVDECSLVSVRLFATLLNILQENTLLRRVVLLGDVRQLPSIEAGNFLFDVFSSFQMLGTSIELRTNHRSESQLIINNATKISHQSLPIFDADKNFTLCAIELEQELAGKVRGLLDSKKSLMSDRNTQFVSFKNSDCDMVNDLCCQFYQSHGTKEGKKLLFQKGDKICMTKNALIPVSVDNFYWILDDGRRIRAHPPEEDVEKDKSDESDLSVNESMSSAKNKSTDKSMIEKKAEDNKEEKKKGPKVVELKLCNGEIFFITDMRVVTEADGRTFNYISIEDEDRELRELDMKLLKKKCKLKHSWARTIHTYQGSESEVLLYVVGDSVRQNWKHVYTAITRGKKEVYVISNQQCLKTAVRKDSDVRRTSLKEKLQTSLDTFTRTHMSTQKKISPNKTQTSNDAWTNAPNKSSTPNKKSVLDSPLLNSTSDMFLDSDFSDHKDGIIRYAHSASSSAVPKKLNFSNADKSCVSNNKMKFVDDSKHYQSVPIKGKQNILNLHKQNCQQEKKDGKTSSVSCDSSLKAMKSCPQNNDSQSSNWSEADESELTRLADEQESDWMSQKFPSVSEDRTPVKMLSSGRKSEEEMLLDEGLHSQSFDLEVSPAKIRRLDEPSVATPVRRKLHKLSLSLE